MVEQYIPLQIQEGVMPSTDATSLSTANYIDADRIRFVNGLPKTIGGWDSVTFDSDNTISGCPRTLFSKTIGNNAWALIGTNTRVYSLLGTELTNITPQVTATTAIANSLANDYTALGADPIDTVSGSTAVTINQTAHLLQEGDTVALSGAATTNGVPNTEINADHIVRSADTNSFTINVTTAATSTGSGGGGSVISASGIIVVTDTAHGLANGDRVTIAAASAVGGVTALEINLEHIIRSTDTNDYQIVTAGTATSSVSGGGGASTARQEQIPAGACDSSLGRGYGMGRFGVGKYGVSKTSTSLLTAARIWSMDSYGDNVMMCAGSQTGVYQWVGSTGTAPAPLVNAPTACNYVFVDKEIVITLGDSGVVNRVKWSDRGAATTWTATAENQAGADDIEGAGKFVSHINVNGINLLFTETQVYSFRYVGQPSIWQTVQVEPNIGIIGQNARVSAGGVAFWMDKHNYYMFSGGSVRVMPNNTVRQYVYDNINTEAYSKCFAWYNKDYNEIWFHHPTGASTECDAYVIFKIDTASWSIGTMDRSCAEYPTQATQYPRMINDAGTLYRHENGVNDDGSGLNAYFETNYLSSGKNTMEIKGLIPDSIQTGDITFTATTKLYPQSSTSTVASAETITPTTERVKYTINGRQRKYRVEQNEVDASFQMGAWHELIEGSSRL